VSIRGERFLGLVEDKEERAARSGRRKLVFESTHVE
jgi:hypothetical protein